MPNINPEIWNSTAGLSDAERIGFAVELERARQELWSCLLENDYAKRFVLEQARSGGRNPEEIPANAENAADTDTELHLLPLYLIEAAGLLARHQGNTVLTGEYKSRLDLLRSRLQAARQRMITANIGLVGFAARKYTTSNLGFDDLMQEGILGLIKAVDRYDPHRGVNFSTYGMYWIRQAISRLIFTQDKIVRLPLPLAEKAFSVFEAMRACYLQNERWPDFAELQRHCDLPEHEIRLIGNFYQATHSLDAPTYDNQDNPDLMESMVQQQFTSPLDQTIDEDLADFLGKAIAWLPENQAAILVMRFGLLNQTEMTLQAIADRLNVTRERVRQIQNQALKKLNRRFGGDLLPFLDAGDGS